MELGERPGSGDGERVASMTRQMPCEPVPASVVLGSCVLMSSPSQILNRQITAGRDRSADDAKQPAKYRDRCAVANAVVIHVAACFGECHGDRAVNEITMQEKSEPHEQRADEHPLADVLSLLHSR